MKITLGDILSGRVRIVVRRRRRKLAETPEVRFFEVCNNGSPFAPAPGLPGDGFDTDRFWDVVNAFRARRGQPLLYGVGGDDTHVLHDILDIAVHLGEVVDLRLSVVVDVVVEIDVPAVCGLLVECFLH